ncbi:hypothetical protein M758_9G046200 [Ceratodon purpureus]|nr:hypothetical protein M758_9G046200 [Ceratodon purpureus]
MTRTNREMVQIFFSFVFLQKSKHLKQRLFLGFSMEWLSEVFFFFLSQMVRIPLQVRIKVKFCFGGIFWLEFLIMLHRRQCCFTTEMDIFIWVDTDAVRLELCCIGGSVVFYSKNGNL